MDTDWFQDAIRQRGATQAELARHLGLAPSAVSRMIKGERQMKIAEAVQVAAFLGVAQEELFRRAGTEGGSTDEPRRRGRPPRQNMLSLPTVPRRDQIPIRATSSHDAPIGHTLCPANLAGVRDAYAIYMMGARLSPRYEEGWLLHVHPFKPPTPGRDVVVWKKDGTAMIKQFLSRGCDVLLLRELSPEANLQVPLDHVVACHLIVGVDQEG